MQQWSVQDFINYVHHRVDINYNETPSMVVLRSFYFGEVEKPKTVTVRQFDWLRSIAEHEMKVYKAQLNNSKS